ncbi:F-box domain-containing protein [Orpheovirus IHUMI-LCC2]|uniref:F-box domain-containing protein n=1 Tax=Orpheovirus IHUMI-LCC2 TaxID=2023057 RepID=A0A2I2L4H5_9VIRU|nr:F-box domain-containing protein [Orpheovirus IHUMI-LCC2]SNW62433.1 F-box domain-containing protein [Orpheovirus IHUMI-LCC2]
MEILPVEVNYLIFDKLDDKDLLSLAYVNKYYPKLVSNYGQEDRTLSKIINYVFFGWNMDSNMFDSFKLQKLMCERHISLIYHIVKSYNKLKFMENVLDNEKYKIEHNVRTVIKELVKCTTNPRFIYKVCYINILDSEVSIIMNNLFQRVNSVLERYFVHEDIDTCIKYFINESCYDKLYKAIARKILESGAYQYYYNLYPTQTFSILVIGWTDENYRKSEDLLKKLVGSMLSSAPRINLSHIDEKILHKLSNVPLLVSSLPYISGLSEDEVCKICTDKRVTNINKILQTSLEYQLMLELLQDSEYYDKYINSDKTEEDIDDKKGEDDDIEQQEIINYYNDKDYSKVEKVIKNDDVDKFLDMYYELDIYDMCKIMRKYLPVNILIMLASMDAKVCYSLTDEEIMEFNMDHISILMENGIINII